MSSCWCLHMLSIVSLNKISVHSNERTLISRATNKVESSQLMLGRTHSCLILWTKGSTCLNIDNLGLVATQKPAKDILFVGVKAPHQRLRHRNISSMMRVVHRPFFTWWFHFISSPHSKMTVSFCEGEEDTFVHLLQKLTIPCLFCHVDNLSGTKRALCFVFLLYKVVASTSNIDKKKFTNVIYNASTRRPTSLTFILSTSDLQWDAATKDYDLAVEKSGQRWHVSLPGWISLCSFSFLAFW